MARVLLKTILKTAGFLFISFVILNSAQASPCCGQNASDLGVMTLGQKFNFMLSQTRGSAMGRVYDGSDDFFVWPGSKDRVVNITQLRLSYKIKERFQTFVSSSYQSGEFQDGGFSQNAHQMMDTTLGLTYEILPEYTFSYYKPTVYLSVFSNLPTGKSVFDGGSGAENIGVTGHGQWGAGVGVTVNKIILPWTLMIQAKTLRLFATDFNEASVDGFFDSSVQIMLGYSLPIWNMSLSLGLTQLELSERQVMYRDQVIVPNSRSTMLSFGIVKPISENLVLSVNYSDQSLLGQPKNTLLSKALSLGLTFNSF